jgi:predicted DNA-binding WGR domain protein
LQFGIDFAFPIQTLRWTFCNMVPKRFGMTQSVATNPAQLQILLERVDAAQNAARYYVLSIEPTLFARDTLVRRWGRINSAGRQRLEFFDSAVAASVALEEWLVRKRLRGNVVRNSDVCS